MDFDQIVSGGTTSIQRMVDTQVQEGLRLEFKGGRVFKDGALPQTAKESLAASLSSLANSAGGVMVFGVDCRRVNGVDCAQSLQPVEQLAVALTIMTEFVADALQPKHDGIRVHAIEAGTATDAGFLIVDVPRSSRRPHMNQYQRTYYKRAGGSKFKMEHYDIEDAFRRQAGPDLELVYELGADRHHLSPTAYRRLMITVAASNNGSGSARDVAIRYKATKPLSDSFPTKQPTCEATVFRDETTCAFPPQIVIHPGATVALRRLFFTVRKESDEIHAKWFDEGKLDIPIQVMAEGMRPITQVLSILREDVIDVAKRL